MKFKKTAALLGATALVALAGPAFAAPPYNVTVGSNTSGDFGFTAATTGPGIAFDVDGPSGTVAMNCLSSGASGDVHAGASSSGVDIATIANTTWATCIGPLGLQMTVEHVGEWQLNATGTATNALTDTVAGNIGNVEAYVYATNAEAQCHFTVTGLANASFAEAGQDLIVNETGFSGNLEVSGVTASSDCFDLVANGNAADFAGTYDVTSPSGAINVKP